MWKTFSGGDKPMGPVASPQATGPGGVAGAGGWHPTVLYLFVLIVVEAMAIAFLSRTVLR